MSITNLSKQLQKQGQVLGDINKGIQSMAKSMHEQTSAERLAQKERERDAAEESRKSNSSSSTSSGSSNDSGSGGFTLPFGLGAGIGGGIGGLAAGATMANALKLGKRTIGGLLLAGAAEDVAAYIESQGGSKEGADAVGRAMQAGGWGMLLGPKFALVSAAVGAVMTPENQEKVAKLGEGLDTLATKISTYVSQIGVTFPTLEEVNTRLARGFGNVVDSLTSVVSGDFIDAVEKFDNDAAMMAAIANQGVREVQRKRRRGQSTGDNPKTEQKLTKAERQQINSKSASKLSAKQLEDLKSKGFGVNKSGGLYNLKTGGQVLNVDKADDLLKSVGAKSSSTVKLSAKTMRALAKFKLPFIGSAIGALGISSIVMDDEMSDSEKTAEISKLLAGMGGATLGGIAGGIVGGPLGAVAGAGLGAFGAEALAESIANWIMGDSNSPIPKGANKAVGTIPKTGQSASGYYDDVTGDFIPTPQVQAKMPQASLQLNEMVGDMLLGRQQAPQVIYMDNSNSSSVVSGGGGGGYSAPLSYHDMYDPHFGLTGTR